LISSSQRVKERKGNASQIDYLLQRNLKKTFFACHACLPFPIFLSTKTPKPKGNGIYGLQLQEKGRESITHDVQLPADAL